MRKVMLKRLGSRAITLGLLLVCHFAAFAQPLVSVSNCSTYSIDERKLYACVYGNGPVTVVLEAGMREDSRAWRFVIEGLSKSATVIAYDRAGMGQSDAGAAPRTSEKIAQELKLLLEHLHARAPYILVGHSAGGWHLRTFAHFYPEAVAGLVLIDSPHEDFEARRDELLTTEEREQRKAMLAESRAGLPEAIRLEYEGLEQSRELYPKLKLPRDLPFVVLAAGRHQWLPERNAQQQEEIWRELQGKLAARNATGKLIIVADSGHNIQRERPDIVVKNILEIVKQVQRQRER